MAGSEAAGPGKARGLSAAALWTGIAAGAFLSAQALIHGVVLPLPGGLGPVVTAAVIVVITAACVVVGAGLLRRHHRAMARHAVRHGKRSAAATGRGAAAAARHTFRHGKKLHSWAASKAGPRWENREYQPLMLCRHPRPAAPAYAWGAADSPHDQRARNLKTATRQAQQASASGTPHVIREYPPGAHSRVIAEYADGKLQSARPSHPSDPSRPPTETEGTDMPVSKIPPDRRARRTAARSGAGVPSEWAAVVAATADFEPENDGELLEWMNRQVAGVSAWAEALVDFYEHCTGTIGIDPKATTMLHDVADSAAHNAETMGAAKTRFTEHYEMPREFAANGGLMTHDGRWVTGEGA